MNGDGPAPLWRSGATSKKGEARKRGGAQVSSSFILRPLNKMQIEFLNNFICGVPVYPPAYLF